MGLNADSINYCPSYSTVQYSVHCLVQSYPLSIEDQSIRGPRAQRAGAYLSSPIDRGHPVPWSVSSLYDMGERERERGRRTGCGEFRDPIDRRENAISRGVHRMVPRVFHRALQLRTERSCSKILC